MKSEKQRDLLGMISKSAKNDCKMAGELQITVFLFPFHPQLKTLHKHSSVESLMVETVLESFDFLNNDCSADELSLFGSVRTGSVRYELLHLGTAKGIPQQPHRAGKQLRGQIQHRNACPWFWRGL